jgi:hypothetical protein
MRVTFAVPAQHSRESSSESFSAFGLEVSMRRTTLMMTQENAALSFKLHTRNVKTA